VALLLGAAAWLSSGDRRLAFWFILGAGICFVLFRVLAILVILGALAMFLVAVRSGLTKDRNLLVVAMIVSLVPPAIMGPQLLSARSVPAIHDISTDTNDPPQFVKAVELRKGAANSLEYGVDLGSASELARLQANAYPGIKSLKTDLTRAEAVARARDVLSALGLEIVNSDPDQGIVEAVATTFWFGFKDDLVVRVKPAAEGSVVDVRSVSRVGRSDLGANAARIEKFLETFQD